MQPLQEEAPAVENTYQNRNQEDLIVLGLEWTVTDDELRAYFEQFGQVTHCEVSLLWYLNLIRCTLNLVVKHVCLLVGD